MGVRCWETPPPQWRPVEQSTPQSKLGSGRGRMVAAGCIFNGFPSWDASSHLSNASPPARMRFPMLVWWSMEPFCVSGRKMSVSPIQLVGQLLACSPPS